MRSTLFYIPPEIGPLPLFGFGWALLGLIVAWLVVRMLSAKAGDVAWGAGLTSWLTTAVVFVWVLPAVESKLTFADGQVAVLGLPVRGYGLMMLCGVVAGTYWTYRRGVAFGLTFDTLLSLAFWGMLGGIVGARLFYIVQKWSELPGQTLIEKLIESLKFTEGGLVVYGGMIGGLLTTAVWCRMRQKSYLMLADIVTPPFLLGLALGRVGCLLNGCCYGAVCVQSLPAVQFPAGSPPYMDQLANGQLIDAAIRTVDENQLEVVQVLDGGWAVKQGLQVGDRIRIGTVPNLEHPASPPEVFISKEKDGRVMQIELPQSSLPVHPSQIYATVNALILCGLLSNFALAFQTRGRIIGLGLSLYGQSRILEEFVRIDEAGLFGTLFSIGQWVSFLGIGVGITLLVMAIQRGNRPTKRAFPSFIPSSQ